MADDTSGRHPILPFADVREDFQVITTFTLIILQISITENMNAFASNYCSSSSASSICFLCRCSRLPK